jgi:hypothetical protein
MAAARTTGALALGAALAGPEDRAGLAASDADLVFEDIATFRAWLGLPPA